MSSLRTFSVSLQICTLLPMIIILISSIFAIPGTATCPSTQSPYAPGCSSCTECCIFQFGESNCNQSLLWDGIVRDPACNTLMIGMDHAWISECTGAFVSCTLYNSTDCTGDLSMTIDNAADVCHAPGFFIKSFDCATD
ncbi:hypothetical protein LTS07_001202 [Exophiala sideris]|uniref:Uncharacterized protein n=1 Tax=Exophiala sideris TaxID=1016849 RepID=A0ABR0JPK5_9EURO|nr:hypothetical protein LTS07_001202 [Exophiala sideris]KAK5043717.1 hypothetical protein LTR13_000071 [Exophiala sideris]KAK5067216.1 hypothetical protein LTR69_001203 [Exophiala sideris]KAK5182549.1 hypothetical protein LTR44_004940 [Eurotiomycetes sp. CCFEE 6388]